MSDVSKAAVTDIRALIHIIRERRIRAAMTIGQMAETIGVSPGAYSQWEAGGAFPSSRKLAVACRAVGLRLIVVEGDAP